MKKKEKLKIEPTHDLVTLGAQCPWNQAHLCSILSGATIQLVAKGGYFERTRLSSRRNLLTAVRARRCSAFRAEPVCARARAYTGSRARVRGIEMRKCVSLQNPSHLDLGMRKGEKERGRDFVSVVSGECLHFVRAWHSSNMDGIAVFCRDCSLATAMVHGEK